MKAIVSIKTKNEEKEFSLSEHLDNIRSDFSKQFTSTNIHEDAWTQEIFTDHVIAESDGKLYRINYTREVGGFVFSPKSDWVEMKKVFVPVDVV